MLVDGEVVYACTTRLHEGEMKLLPLPKKKLRSVDSFLTKSQPPNILLSTLQGLLDDNKPFFSRWLWQWKNRNKGS